MTDDLNISIEVKTGKIFELARKELGLTKSEVSEATFMNIGYVNAIESGDYSIFPSEGFAKAYFIKYQNFLSLECEFPPIYNDKNRQEEIINKSIAKINPSIYPIIRVTGIFIIVVAIICFININFLNQFNIYLRDFLRFLRDFLRFLRDFLRFPPFNLLVPNFLLPTYFAGF